MSQDRQDVVLTRLDNSEAVDDELEAIRVIDERLEQLTSDERARVLVWVSLRNGISPSADLMRQALAQSDEESG